MIAPTPAITAVAVGMLVTLALACFASFRGDAGHRLVAAQLVAVIAAHLALVLSLQPGIAFYADVALLLAIANFISSLLYARFLERWL